MHNKWNSANVDQVLLRKGEEHLLYRGPEAAWSGMTTWS